MQIFTQPKSSGFSLKTNHHDFHSVQASHDDDRKVTETFMYDMLIGEEDASPNWDPEMNW